MPHSVHPLAVDVQGIGSRRETGICFAARSMAGLPCGHDLLLSGLALPAARLAGIFCNCAAGKLARHTVSRNDGAR